MRVLEFQPSVHHSLSGLQIILPTPKQEFTDLRGLRGPPFLRSPTLLSVVCRFAFYRHFYLLLPVTLECEPRSQSQGPRHVQTWQATATLKGSCCTIESVPANESQASFMDLSLDEFEKNLSNVPPHIFVLLLSIEAEEVFSPSVLLFSVPIHWFYFG